MSWKSVADIVNRQLRAIKGSAQKQLKLHLMGGEDGVQWLHPPDLRTYFLMIEFDCTRSDAEFIANIT